MQFSICHVADMVRCSSHISSALQPLFRATRSWTISYYKTKRSCSNVATPSPYMEYLGNPPCSPWWESHTRSSEAWLSCWWMQPNQARITSLTLRKLQFGLCVGGKTNITKSSFVKKQERYLIYIFCWTNWSCLIFTECNKSRSLVFFFFFFYSSRSM